jgi:hypothetical protein
MARPARRGQGNLLWLIAAGIGLILLAIAATLSMNGGGDAGDKVPVEVEGAPSLKADQAEVNLGDVKLGQTVQASFTISNIGDQPLTFSGKPYIEVVAGC